MRPLIQVIFSPFYAVAWIYCLIADVLSGRIFKEDFVRMCIHGTGEFCSKCFPEGGE